VENQEEMIEYLFKQLLETQQSVDQRVAERSNQTWMKYHEEKERFLDFLEFKNISPDEMHSEEFQVWQKIKTAKNQIQKANSNLQMANEQLARAQRAEQAFKERQNGK
jgi:hypothetical protein